MVLNNSPGRGSSRHSQRSTCFADGRGDVLDRPCTASSSPTGEGPTRGAPPLTLSLGPAPRSVLSLSDPFLNFLLLLCGSEIQTGPHTHQRFC